MTDSLKFGPEWLRNLSSEGNTGGAPKYQLAEHRYGREEMLALFDRNVRAPDPLVKLQGLYVEKTQTPMALLTMTEEETRQWHKGINSDVVLRLNGKTLIGPPGGVLRGRGGLIDRGRGRLRGSGGFHYTRGLSCEEPSDSVKEGPSDRPFSRSLRSFDRSQGSERSWGERNGGESGDWNGSTSPRKEFASMKDFSGSGRNSNENWRRHRGIDDEDGWRKSDRWGRSNSWRDEADTGDGAGLSKSTSRTSSWGRGWADEGLRGRSHDENSLSTKRNHFADEVPEWAMENPSESGGSFDASGAFHGGNYSDEEEENISSRNLRHRLSDDMSLRHKSKSPPRLKKNEECEEPGGLVKDRKLLRSQTAQENLADASKAASHSLSKSQSSSNLKSESTEIKNVTSKRTESQNFDRIRVQHQNFIDKNDTNKELSDVNSEVKNLRKKEDKVEPDNVIEEVLKSETSVGLDAGVSNIREKNSVFVKEKINSLSIDAGSCLGGGDFEREGSVNRQGSEEDMERMAEVVKDTVVKLFEDEEKVPVNLENDKWYYRDPQGVVQGPFKSSEMLGWFMNGYFQLSLLVRREQDEIYVKLGDLMIKCGKIPFLPGVNLPVLKADSETPQQPPPATAQPQSHGLSQPDMFMQQYHQYQLLQKQFLLSQQLALNKLSQSEMWNTLNSVQQRGLLMQKLAMAQQPSLSIDQLAQVEKNSFSQLLAQMQQTKMPMPEVRDTKTMDPLRQLLQNMNVLQTNQPPLVTSMNPSGMVLNHHLNAQPHLNSVLANKGLNHTTSLGVEESKVEDPIQSLLRQLGNQSNLITPPAPTPTDSLWGAPGRTQHWPPQASQPANTGGMPIWEIRTEQQILAEQLRLEEERRQEELRKRKEEEEEAARKQKELEEKKRKVEEKREEMKKLELKRIEEEKIKIQREKEKEEKKKAEELKRKQQQEEALKKKQETAKKMQEAQKKLQEAQKKKEEKERKKEEEREKKRLLEEGKKKLENEKKKKEEEQQRLKKKQMQEEEETSKKQEQVKKPSEALKKTQDQPIEPFKKPLPWCQPTVTTPGTSLSDIQKMQEKEKKQQLLREQQLAFQKAQEKEMHQMQKESDSQGNGLNLKWAEQMPKVNPSVKSLAEIQAEEQLQLAKQLEKERLERAQQQREAALTANNSIWGSASQSLTWSSNSAPWGGAAIQNNSSSGFWDEVASNNAKTKTKTPASPQKGKSQTTSTQKPSSNAGTSQKASKPKAKKEEAAVMKLFERVDDEFTTWCSASLQSMQSDIDIPTFVSFLRDVESPFEVAEYVKCYIGDGKEAQEFAKQFLERRSRWMSSKKANSGDDDRNGKFQGINSGLQYQVNAGQEFQEVKGKGKKSKKGKMLKVDNRILGFSVTAAPDRINIGDRDYVNHNM